MKLSERHVEVMRHLLAIETVKMIEISRTVEMTSLKQ
jgi:hypothetical protein